MGEWTVTKKADRAKMADSLIALVNAHGFNVERRDPGHPKAFHGPRCTEVRIEAARGVCLNIDLDGDDQQQRHGTFVLSWHMNPQVEASRAGTDHKFRADFAPSVNPFHFHKATDICEGFGDLYETVEKRLASLSNGSAFQ